jgi:hypothetical protein
MISFVSPMLPSSKDEHSCMCPPTYEEEPTQQVSLNENRIKEQVEVRHHFDFFFVFFHCCNKTCNDSQTHDWKTILLNDDENEEVNMLDALSSMEVQVNVDEQTFEPVISHSQKQMQLGNDIVDLPEPTNVDAYFGDTEVEPTDVESESDDEVSSQKVENNKQVIFHRKQWCLTA